MAKAQQDSIIASRYVTALFELAQERGAVEAVEAELQQLKGALRESAAFRALINNPALAEKPQGASLAALMNQFGASELLKNFLATLVKNRRLAVLDEIIDAFEARSMEQRGELLAKVETAHALDEAQQGALRDQLAAAMGKKIRLQATVNPSLLGGLKVIVGGRLLDASLAGRLDQMKDSLVHSDGNIAQENIA